jgi:hypothetical protein
VFKSTVKIKNKEGYRFPPEAINPFCEKYIYLRQHCTIMEDSEFLRPEFWYKLDA